MLIPKRCPRCRDHSQWTEVYNPHNRNSFQRIILLIKGCSASSYIYRCGKCGYQGEYSNHAETLKRRL